MLLSTYASLLKLYPETYQSLYSSQMLQTMSDILTHESRGRRILTLLKEVLTTPVNALEQYVIEYSKSRLVTPQLIVNILALLLLAPFFIALILDEITEFITSGGHLYATWLWSRPVLFIWIAVLPFVSLAVSLSVYILSLMRQCKREKKVSPLAKRYWLTLLTAIISIGILLLVTLPDSVHCWLDSGTVHEVVSCTDTGVLTSDSH